MEDTQAPTPGDIAPLDIASTVRGMRDMLQKRIDTPVVPVGVEFLGTILGCLHIITQILDVASTDNKNHVIEISGSKFTVGEFLLLCNVVLTMAGEKLDIPAEFKNV